MAVFLYGTTATFNTWAADTYDGGASDFRLWTFGSMGTPTVEGSISGTTVTGLPAGWSVNKISGNWGQTNAVLEVTTPALNGEGDYRGQMAIRHQNSGTLDAAFGQFWMRYPTIDYPNAPRHGCTLNIHGEVFWGTTQYNGTQFYRVPSPSSKIALGFLPNVEWCAMAITLDGQLVVIGSPFDVEYNLDHVAYVSHDGGLTFEPLPNAPTPSLLVDTQYKVLSRLDPDTLYLTTDSNPADKTHHISYNAGQAWVAYTPGNDPFAFQLPRTHHNWQSGRNVEVRLGRGGANYRAFGESGSAGYYEEPITMPSDFTGSYHRNGIESGPYLLYDPYTNRYYATDGYDLLLYSDDICSTWNPL